MGREGESATGHAIARGRLVRRGPAAIALIVAVVVPMSACSATKAEPVVVDDVPAATSAPMPTSPSGTEAQGARGRLAALPPLEQRRPFTRPPVAPTVATPADVGAAVEELQRRATATPLGERPDDAAVRVRDATPVRWVNLVVDIARRRSLNPMRLTRAVSATSVAMHDAVVATAGVSWPEGDPPAAAASPQVPVALDDLGAPGAPMEWAASVAAHRVASHLFPDEVVRLDVVLAVAEARAAASGRWWPGELDAARTLGESVADAVILHLRRDGAEPWNPATAPPVEGGWVPTPPNFAPPVEPEAGGWRGWNSSDLATFRPGPPPAVDSPEFAAAVSQVRQVARNLSDADLQLVRFWAMDAGTSTPPGYWLLEVAGPTLTPLTVEDQAMAFALLAAAMSDTSIALWGTKYHYGLVRPVTVIRAAGDATWLPSLVTPAHPAYPSGHAAYSGAGAAVLAMLLPERREDFLAAAADAADSRVLAGIHYWFDASVGLELGLRIAESTLQQRGLEPPSDLPSPVDRLRFGEASAR